SRRFELPTLHSGMAVDPEGRWVALHTVLTLDYTGINVESGNAPVITAVEGETRNEVLVVDVDAPPSQAVTSHLFSSPEVVPKRLSFAPTRQLPGTPGQLLAVETENEISILDLARVSASPQAEPIVVATLDSSEPETEAFAEPHPPAELLYDDGD